MNELTDFLIALEEWFLSEDEIIDTIPTKDEK